MCGIALILSGVSIVRPDLDGEQSLTPPQPNDEHKISFVPDLNAALLRRGPDCLGEKKVLLNLRCTPYIENDDELSHSCTESDNYTCSSFRHHQNVILNSITTRDDEKKPEKGGLFVEKEDNNITSVHEIAFPQYVTSNRLDFSMELHFIGATLHLRGLNPVRQPVIDSSGNILIYNGEIFGGIHVDADKNDGEALLHALGSFHSCECYSQGQKCYCISKGEVHVRHILSTIRGPWALIYWQARSRTLWFGRDAFGRRSLLVHWPTVNVPQFVLSSVSSQSKKKHSDVISDLDELPCGIYSIYLGGLKYNPHDTKKKMFGMVKKHGWSDPFLKELIQWERIHVDPSCGMRYDVHPMKEADTRPAHKVLTALRESVMRRTVSSTIFQNTGKLDSVPVAILFSGGLDSMILATLLDECLNSTYTIDLLNVSFDGVSAPDRISAWSGLKELQGISSSRRWRLVEIDAELSNLTSEMEHLKSLIYPAETYMDLNIGIALWLAANGEGVVDGNSSNYHESGCCGYKYKSDARILLVGSGADEQCAGYGRHRSKYKARGWAALDEEMKLDMHRIWKRNLGRDDRCISDHGKEARFPFLDEDVIKSLLDIPLWEIANLDEPSGKGDKKILREVAKLLGLDGAAVLPKRAIQFGSRIARESNRHNFGSNRAANQASAGSVVIGAGAGASV